ncbi:MAG: metallophosphoesterase, partial [Leptospiraceae bacterium]|nr:metallophosphoesterase [Leptospiraceae bacterium]
MKFESDRTYRAIFLSDVHYLLDKKIKFHRHQDLFRLLDYFRKNNIRFKKVILAGDIIENWFFSATRKYRRKQKRFDKLFDRLDAIAARKGKRIYIVGNHDTTSFTMQLPDDIHNYLDKRGWSVREEYSNGDYVVVHGHQGQYNKISWAFHIAMVRFFHWLAVI